MKTGTHPDYQAVVVTCNGCGTKHELFSTRNDITIEICSQCHPFYTGKQKLVDIAGRVDKFRARQAAAEQSKTSRVKTTAKSKEESKKDKVRLDNLEQTIETTAEAAEPGPEAPAENS